MTEIKLPWLEPPLNEWSIVGMNHYRDAKHPLSTGQALYVAMTKGNLCIRSEGRDQDVWKDLRVKSIMAPMPQEFVLDFDPKKSQDPAINTIFADREGGLIWCALRYCRLADQFFNQKVATMLIRLRDSPRAYSYAYSSDIESTIPESILSNTETREDWADVLVRVVDQSLKYGSPYRFTVRKGVAQ